MSSSPEARRRAAIDFVIDRLEGGERLVEDSGGLTKYGISQKAYPGIDIRGLSRDKAIELYVRDYWDRVCASEFEPGLGLLLFDHAVNGGPVSAVKLLQRVVIVADDGIVGQATLRAVRNFGNARELCARYIEIRLRAYEELARSKPVYQQYLFGWRCRVARVALEAGRIGSASDGRGLTA